MNAGITTKEFSDAMNAVRVDEREKTIRECAEVCREELKLWLCSAGRRATRECERRILALLDKQEAKQ
jgi:hypothetical protein